MTLTKLARLEESIRARKEEKEVIGDWKTCPKLHLVTPYQRVQKEMAEWRPTGHDVMNL